MAPIGIVLSPHEFVPSALIGLEPDIRRVKILAYFPGSREGFVAVSRHGKGGVVAIGLVGLAGLGEHGQCVDNARLRKTLLTTKVGR